MSEFEAYRLSPVQREIWKASGLAATLTARLRLAEPPHHDRLQAAVNALVDSHEALRLRLVELAAVRVPVQTVDEQRCVVVRAHPPLGPRASGTAPDAGPDRNPDTGTATGPVPVSVALTPAGELVLSVSALAADPTSLTILVRDLVAHYASAAPAQDPDRLQFIDVSEWLFERIEQARQDPLAAPEHQAVSSIDLARCHDEETAGVDSADGPAGVGEVRAQLTGAAHASLVEWASARGAAPDRAVLAAWALALAQRCTDEGECLALAWYASGRTAPGTAAVVGPLDHYAPLNIPLPLPDCPTALVDSVLEAAAQLEQTLDLPYQAADLDAVAAGFAAEAAPDPAELSAMAVSDVSIDLPPACGPLHLGCLLRADRIELTLRFDRSRYSTTGARLLLDAVVAIVASLPAALPGSGPLRLLGVTETELLRRWGHAPGWSTAAGATATRAPDCLLTVLDDALAAVDGTTEAVLAPDGTLSYAELDRMAAVLASRLRQAGLQSEDRVAVLAERSWRTVVAFLGVLRAGAVYVPVEPAQPPSRLRGLAELVNARLILGGPPNDHVLSRLADQFRTADLDSLVESDSVTERPQVAPHHGAYIIFTSGSTGTPRPVLIEHRSAVHLFFALRHTVYVDEPPGLRISLNAPFTFDASIKQLIQLGAGHTLCLIREDQRQDPAALLAQLGTQRVDVLDATPSHLRLLLTASDPTTRWPRLVLVGGEAIDAELWHRLAALDGVRCVNLYGPTECTVDITAADVSGPTPSIGRPLPGNRIWVLDAALRSVPAGVPGELVVSGPQLARGYLGDDQATARRFVTAAAIGEDPVRLYRTGDRVRFLADGRLEYLGRLDDQLKIRGFRVEPGEVEVALRQHPGVRQAVVIGRDDDGSGTRLVGYVVPAATAPATLDISRLEGLNPHETRYLYDEIFVQRTYLRGGVVLAEHPVVFDTGANIGMFSLFVHTICPTATIYAFEPLAPVCRKLERNLAAHGVSAHVFDYGLSDTSGDVTFTYYTGYSMMSGQSSYADSAADADIIRTYLENRPDQYVDDRAGLLERLDELLDARFAATEQRCRVRRLSEVIDEHDVRRIDLFKVDVQRAELDVLHGIDDRHWPLIEQIAMEVHDAVGTPTEGRVDHIAQLLEDRGFEVLVEQDAALQGTDRFALSAVRPRYAARTDLITVAGAEEVASSSTHCPEGPELCRWLAGRLPAHLVPSAIVHLDKLPLTANGKLDRAALPPPNPQPGGPGARPENRTEEILVEAWQQVLGRSEVGVTDNVFLDLGADSIRCIQLQVAAGQRGLTIPLRSIFTHQTIRELVRVGGVALVEAAPQRTDSAFCLVSTADWDRLPDGLDDAYPMSALQVGMVYHTELTGDPATYHNVTVHQVGHRLEEATLRAALEQTVAAHPILRTSFDLGRYREPLQLVHHTARVDLAVDDLLGLDQAEQRRRITAAIEQELGRRFDWALAPLVRFRALRTGADTFEFLVSEHHCILDGWSLHLLIDEALHRYEDQLRPDAAERAVSGAPQGAPALPYRRFIELETQARHDTDTLRFWTSRLAGVRPSRVVSALGKNGMDATDIARVEPPCITADWPVPLPARLCDRLQASAAGLQVPLKALLLAVHLRVLGEALGRDDVVTGLVVSGRPGEPGGDRTLGLFLNTLPLRLDLGGDSLADLALRTWRAEQELMGHHLCPLADIERAIGRGRLFDSFFNFTRFHPLAADAQRLVPSHTIPVDVAFSLAVDVEAEPDGNGLHLVVQHDGRRLRTDRVAGFAERYLHLLEVAIAEPHAAQPALPSVRRPAEQPWAARVREVWQELIGAPPRGPDTDFFDAGGDSLLALRFVVALRDRFGAQMSLPEFIRQSRYDSLVALCRRPAGVPVRG